MKKMLAITAISLPLVLASSVWAQTTTTPADTTPAPAAPADSTTTPPVTQGLKPAEGVPGNSMPAQQISGWSVKDRLGKSVYNEADEKVGEIQDIVMADSGAPAYFIVGAGGFLGMGEHKVAIPYDRITGTSKLMLQGYTKDQLKALPPVEIAK
ncbi:MAG: PRC-barrel domain-containing protein [Burkholderiaceae bacterium]|nr:PRC-barrel domain-containing protein [Burkholderiaceae bacterium]